MWITVWTPITPSHTGSGRCDAVSAVGDDFPTIWRRALDALDASGVTPQQRAFVRLARPVGLLDGTALLVAPNDLTKEVLEQRMRQPIVDLLSAELGRPVRLAVTVDPSIATSAPPMTVTPAGPSAPLPAEPPRDVRDLREARDLRDLRDA